MIHLSRFNGTQEGLINSVHQQRLSLHLCLLFFFLNSRILFLEILDENIIITNLLIIYINLNFMMRSILTVLQVELLKKILTFIQIFDLFNIFDRQLKKKKSLYCCSSSDQMTLYNFHTTGSDRKYKVVPRVNLHHGSLAGYAPRT